MTEILGYLLAVLIGISLGLIGGGGSILTVPVLVYVLSINPVTATSYSLFVVGSTAFIGAIRSFLGGNLVLTTGIWFAVPSLMAVWFTRAYIIPSIPYEIFSAGGFVVTREIGIMVFFAVLMIASSLSMIRSRTDLGEVQSKIPKGFDNLLIVAEGLAVGMITGIVGAGGGFLIVPALVLLAGLPMKKAVGTSLMIIAAKSLIGFTGDLSNEEIQMNWRLLMLFTTMSVIGVFIGISLARRIHGGYLKKAFGYFVLVMGIYILIERVLNVM